MERYLVTRGLNRIILLPIILSVLYAGVLVWQLYRMLDADRSVQHTSQVLILSNQELRHIQFQESALRGYDITPDSIFLSQYRREETKVDSMFELLHLQILDNPGQLLRLDSLMQVYWTWESSARNSLSGIMAAQNFLGIVGPLTGEDSTVLVRAKIMETMRQSFGRLIAEERHLYAVRLERFRQGTTLLLIIIGIASIGLGAILGLYARRQAKRFVHRFTNAIDETMQSRDLLETTLLSIDDAVIVTGANTEITMMNARAQALTGWTWGEAKGRLLDQVFHVVSDDDRSKVENPALLVLREQKPIQLKDHTTLLSRSGVEYPVEQSASPVHNSSREIVAIVIVFHDVSEVREHERQAEQREREFRALIESAPDIVIRYAPNLTITYANPAIQTLLGVSPSTIIGRRYKELGIPEDVYGPWEQAVEEVFKTGLESSGEIHYRTLSGSRTYHTRLVPEGDTHAGTKAFDVQNVISIARDVTEMKQADQRLRESEQRFRSIIENSPDAFFIIHAIRKSKKNDEANIIDFTIEHINGPARDLLPMPAGDLLGRRLSDLMPGPRAEAQIEKFTRILESGVATREEQRAEPNAQAGERWFQMQYIPIGDLVGITASEITDRVKTVHDLERSEERYRRLVEHASEAIFSTDSEGRFTYANPYVRELGGYGKEDITKYVFTDLVAPAHRERVKRHFYKQFLSRTPTSYIEAPFLRQSGGEVWLAVTATIELRGEEVEGFDCIGTDITELKRIERELEVAKRKASRNDA